MKTSIPAAIVALICSAITARAQTLSSQWQELTAPDFVQALELSKHTCALPFGIIEKHGPAGPLGTDLMNVRYTTTMAAKKEYTIIFPEYYFGQIFEARHQPGTLAYSTKLQLDLLQETVSEMARNGCSKVIIVNGHGGNNALLQYFGQIQLDSPKDYVVYTITNAGGAQDMPAAAKPSKPGVDGHAGEGEISNVMASRPGLAHPERSATQSGADQNRLSALPANVYTGIWWYAKFPNHYQGDSADSTATRGQAATTAAADRIADAIKAIKADETAAKLQQEFFEKAGKPTQTKQGGQ